MSLEKRGPLPEGPPDPAGCQEAPVPAKVGGLEVAGGRKRAGKGGGERLARGEGELSEIAPGKGGLLATLMVAGVIAGGVFGATADGAVPWVRLLGEIFIRMLQMLVVPLVLSSVISSVGSLGDLRRAGRTGLATFLYYLLTTLSAVILGVILVELVEPGVGATPPASAASGDLPYGAKEASPAAAAAEILRNLFHPSLIGAMAEGKMLPLILFSLLFGGCLTAIPPRRAKPVIALAEGIFEALMKLVLLVMWFAPLGLFGLIGAQVAEAGGAGGVGEELAKIGKYFVTVVTGLAIHGFVVLPAVCLMAARRSPFAQFRAFGKALIAAFGTASSSATLPLTVGCAIDQASISARVANFVLPVGATINMDGTALYEAVASIFIAQVYGVPLGFGQTLVIVVAATLAAIGAAGIPHAGLFTMVIVLTAVGLPVEGTAMLFAVDWLLDRFRTAVNVWGDAVGAAVIDRMEKEGYLARR